MLSRATIDFVVTERAGDRIRSFVASAGYPAMAGLLYGRDETSGEEGWRVGLYDAKEIEQTNFGAIVVVLDRMELVVAQPTVMKQLAGMKLDWDGAHYRVTPK